MSQECEVRRWPPRNLSLVAVLLGLGSSFSLGFQLLITNPAENAFLSFLNESRAPNFEDRSSLENEWSIMVGIFFLGAAVGSFLIRMVAEKLGRKLGVFWAVVLQAISSIVTILSYWVLSPVLFTIARFSMGVCVAISMGLSNMFVTEASPVRCRGVASLINGVLLQFSICIGAIMAMPKLLGNEKGWWYLHLFQLITNIVVLFFLPLVHESPGFLAFKNYESALKKAIAFYHNVPDPFAHQIAESLIASHHRPRSRDTILSVWRDPYTRRGTLLGMVVTFSMAMSGITVVNAFGFQLLKNAGLDEDEAAAANVAVCIFSLAGIAVSTRLIDNFGRRPLLLFTFSGLVVVNIVIISLMTIRRYYEDLIVAVTLISAICIFNFLFAMGPGPVSSFLTGELVSIGSRSASSAWTSFVMAIMRFIALSVYTPIRNYTYDSVAYAVLFIFPMDSLRPREGGQRSMHCFK